MFPTSVFVELVVGIGVEGAIEPGPLDHLLLVNKEPARDLIRCCLKRLQRRLVCLSLQRRCNLGLPFARLLARFCWLLDPLMASEEAGDLGLRVVEDFLPGLLRHLG